MPFFTTSRKKAIETTGRRHRFLFIFLFFSFVLPVFCRGYLVRHYGESDGLPTSEVFDIAQDHLGRMWFATRSGVSCYNGVSWENHTVSDGVAALSIFKIAVDRRGRVWALADPGRQTRIFVALFDGREWEQLERLKIDFRPNVKITSFRLFADQEDNPVLVVGTAGSGLFLWKGGKWTRLTTKDGLLSNAVNGIAVLKDKCYIATAEGVAVLNRGGTFDPLPERLRNLPAGGIRGICVEHSGRYLGYHLKEPRVWLCGDRWVGYFEESDYNINVFREPTQDTPLNDGTKIGQTCRLTPPSEGIVIFDTELPLRYRGETLILTPDYRGGLYIGSTYRIYYLNYKTGVVETIGIQNGLLSSGCSSLFVDFEKNTWISSARGLDKIASRRFSNYRAAQGLLEDEVTAVVEYRPGKFVLGHNRGVTFWEDGKFQPVPFSSAQNAALNMSRVMDMKVDSKQNIWVAADNSGLAKINKKKEIKWLANDLPGVAWCLWIDKNNDVWAGTRGGLALIKGNKDAAQIAAQSPSDPIRKIYRTMAGTLCIASARNGLFMYKTERAPPGKPQRDVKPGRWVNYRHPGKSRANSLYAIMEDSRGRLLVGTLAGLYFLKKTSIEKFKEKDFEINRPVYFIIEDRKQDLWFGTNNGVVRWDGGRAIHYSLPEGLIGQETNRAAGLVDSVGRLWIGTNRGLSIYNEQFDSFMDRIPAPKLRLLYVEADDRKIPLDKKVELSPKTLNLIFHFSGISFINEEALLFRHKLEGLDRQWISGQYPYNRTIRYSRLSPGSYRLHLQARNALNVWSEPLVSPEVVIIKPIVKRWWFSILIILIILVIFYGIFRFFTQQRYAALLEKQVEARTSQVRSAERRYRTLFEESKDVIFISTPEGTLVDMNPAGLELFGIKAREDLLKKEPVTALYYNPADRVLFREEIEKKGYVKDYELNLKDKDGEKIVAQVTAAVVRDKGGNIAVYRGIIRDISDKKRLEQRLMQSQKMEAIGTLAGGIAHDFNNILGVISGYTELALDDYPDAAAMRGDIEQISAASERAADLVNQILAFSRQGEVERKPLSLDFVLNEALKLLRSSLPATIEIRRETGIKSGVVMADLTQMHQVIMNLCTNAAHAMGEEGGVLAVGLHKIYLDAQAAGKYQDIEAGAYLRLSVGDSGHGIPRAMMKRIFEPFFTTKKKGEGTGMGLSVVHGIVKSHGGDITVYSETGRGATFHVLLPALEEAVQGAAKTEEEIPPGRGERILFVDDEEGLISAGTLMLQRLGYEVVGKTAPLEALESFRAAAASFDLLLTDLTMPQLTGLELAAEVRKIEPGIPIVFCSGFSASISVEKIEAFAPSTFVMKPIIKRELARALREVLDGIAKSGSI
ncbi:MAG: PAS domain S-box protein [Candidatus Aminicenantes bacterium]|nr:PAS domain S-box protein [Candidatus Aminicenantes bacterium]